MQNFSDATESASIKLKEMEDALAEYQSKIDSAVAAAKRAEEMRTEKDFYRIQLSDIDLHEIEILKDIVSVLRDKEVFLRGHAVKLFQDDTGQPEFLLIPEILLRFFHKQNRLHHIYNLQKEIHLYKRVQRNKVHPFHKDDRSRRALLPLFRIHQEHKEVFPSDSKPADNTLNQENFPGRNYSHQELIYYHRRTLLPLSA